MGRIPRVGRIVDLAGKPIDRRPVSPAEAQMARLQMELALGREALRFLAGMLAKRRGRKHSISEEELQQVQAKGYRVSMRKRNGRVTVQLVAPGEQAPPMEGESKDA